jgi:elongator complex protein 6
VDGLTGLFASESAPTQGSQHVLKSSGGIQGVRTVVEAALAQLKTEKKVLVLDQPDVLLAASGGDIGSQAVHNLILQLREVCPPSASSTLSDLWPADRKYRTYMLRY